MAARYILNMKKVLLLFLLLLPACLWAAPIIQDKADLLTEDEEQQLYAVMAPIEEYGGVAFVTNRDEYDGGADDLAYFYCHQFFNGQSGIVFLIDMYNRRIELYSTGKIYDVLGRMWSDIIADNVYQNATDEKYFLCAKRAFSQMVTILNGGKVGAPMRYVSSILLGVALAFLFMYYKLYNSRKKARFGKKMNLLKGVAENELKIAVLKKVLVYTQTITHSSGGGGRGGGGGGGGRSGGGGGHGF